MYKHKLNNAYIYLSILLCFCLLFIFTFCMTPTADKAVSMRSIPPNETNVV